MTPEPEASSVTPPPPAKAIRTPRKRAAAAGPRHAPAASAPTAPALARLDELQALILASLEDDKAENPVTIDLVGRAAFADRMVIATGLADRQIAAMAAHLERKLHEAGVKRVSIEGEQGADWVLIDAGDLVVHLFKAEARGLYALEKMWGAELDEDADRSKAG